MAFNFAKTIAIFGVFLCLVDTGRTAEPAKELVLAKDTTLLVLPIDEQAQAAVSSVGNLAGKQTPVVTASKGMTVKITDQATGVKGHLSDVVYEIVNNRANKVQIDKDGKIKWYKVRLIERGVPSATKEGWVPTSAVVDPVMITRTRWRPLSDFKEDHSILEVFYIAGRSDRTFTLALYATQLATPSGDEGIAPAVPAPAPITGSREKQPLFTASVRSKSAREEMAELQIAKGYQFVSPIRLQIGVLADESDSNNVPTSLFDVAVAEPRPLSFELQADAPLANTREDRVELWLRRYRNVILAEAEKRGVSGAAIAGPIAWEALVNIKSHPGRGVGPGAVHLTDSKVQLLNPLRHNERGSGVAKQVEDLGTLPKLTIAERKQKLISSHASIEYVAAILGSYVQIAKAEYAKQSKVFPPNGPHSDNAPLLANFYQGLKIKGGRGGEQYLDLVNAHDYFANKARAGEGYTLRSNPNEDMDAWVQQNHDYLKRAVSEPRR